MRPNPCSDVDGDMGLMDAADEAEAEIQKAEEWHHLVMVEEGIVRSEIGLAWGLAAEDVVDRLERHELAYVVSLAYEVSNLGVSSPSENELMLVREIFNNAINRVVDYRVRNG